MSRIIRVGARCCKSFRIKQEDVSTFGKLIEDFNPIHSNAEAAKGAGFPNCVCYGMFVGSLFSGLMASEIPGPNTVYLSQKLRFIAPVYVGDLLNVSVEVCQFRKSKGLLALKTVIDKKEENGGDDHHRIVCVDGIAVGINKEVSFEGDSPWTVKL